jgi:hypothetical protein
VACRYECGAHLRSGHQKRIGSPAGDHRVVAGGANACVEEWHLRLVERLAAENHSPPNAALPRAFALAPSGRRSSVILASGVARTQVLDRTLETRLRAQDGGDGPLRLAPAASGASVRNRRREATRKQRVRRMPRCRLAAGLYLPAPGAHCHTRQSRSLSVKPARSETYRQRRSTPLQHAAVPDAPAPPLRLPRSLRSVARHSTPATERSR